MMHCDQTLSIPRFASLSVLVLGLGGTWGVAWMGNESIRTAWLGALLTLVVTLLLHRRRDTVRNSLGLLDTPFSLSHDAEVFDRYQRISQQMLRISQRGSVVFRSLAMQRLDEMAVGCTAMGRGVIDFEQTETWRIAYEQLLREPTVFSYRSVALVRHPQYWQDAAGTGSMQFNFQLIEQHVLTIERIVLIADELWPKGQDLPVEELRQWIHEQSVHGIWLRLARLSDLRKEPELVRDLGIYGQLAVGRQELADDNLRTLRFSLNFELSAVREAERQWEKLGVYAVAYKELLTQFRL